MSQPRHMSSKYSQSWHIYLMGVISQKLVLAAAATIFSEKDSPPYKMSRCSKKCECRAIVFKPARWLIDLECRLRNLDLESKQLFHSVFQAIASGRDVPLNLALDSFSDELTASIEAFFEAFKKAREESSGINTPRATELPRVIRFPYARHSSYEELCHFVDAFKPLDVWPCTEDAEYWWRNSMFKRRVYVLGLPG